MRVRYAKFIPIFEPSIAEKEIKYILDAVSSGWVSSKGEFINEFEKKFAEYIGVKYATTTSNGTAALHLALLSLGIKAGDEVIVPELTFIATANAVTYTGAKPVLVDIDPYIWCIDPEKVEKAITKRTKAIIPVHIFGHPTDMDSIIEIAKNHNIWVIEDAAEAHGAEYKGKKVGGIGDIGIFSFYGNKIITTGEGGMITTNNEEIFEKIHMLKNHGMDKVKKYWHPIIGYNYRMTNLQAALGLAQLERIDEFIDKKRLIFNWYRDFLGDIEGVRLNPETEWAKNVYWMVSAVLDSDKIKISRDQLASRLRAEGIDTRPFFSPISEMPYYNNGITRNHIAKYLSRSGLNFPSGSKLSMKDVSYICNKTMIILKDA